MGAAAVAVLALGTFSAGVAVGVPRVGHGYKVPAVFGAHGIKPYRGYEDRFPTSFPLPKIEHGKHFLIGCQNPVNAGNQTTTTFCLGVQAEARALGMR